MNRAFTTRPGGAENWNGNSLGAGAKLICRMRSLTTGLSGKVRKNTYMENLVQLPDGRHVYMTNKEIEQLNGK